MYTRKMGKRVKIQTDYTVEEVHERYRHAKDAVERTRLPHFVAGEGGPNATDDS